MAGVKLALFLCFFSIQTVVTDYFTWNHELVKDDDTCPPWQVRSNATGICECVKATIHDVVACSNKPYQLAVHDCYCMTYGNHQPLVGPCLYTCHRGFEAYTLTLNITVDPPTKLNEVVCGRFKREGQVCGACIHGYAPPIYSYSLSCVSCSTSNWGKYTAVSLLPLTAFFVFVVTFRIRATSPTLHGFILFSQLITCSSNMRNLEITLPLKKKVSPVQRHLVQALVSFCGVWNLDFFRLVYTPFCLHPQATNLQVLALDYLPAVYPLLLIGLSYLLVLLYDHNVRAVVCLCKPFVTLLVRFRRQWNIRSSLVDAFATFLLLSYVKILSVSVDLLLPVPLYGQNDQQQHQFYLFNQGNVAYFSSQHLPYACLAIFFLFTFTLLPMSLLFLYPCSWFQVCLNRTGCSCQSLHIFMDSFQGHFKNGTNDTRDFRYFSALYLLLRGLVYASTVLAYLIYSYTYTSVLLTVFTALVAITRPHSTFRYTISDTFFLVLTDIVYMTLIPLIFYHSPVTEMGIQPFWFIIGFPIIVLVTGKWIGQCRLACSKLIGVKARSPSEDGYESLNNR